MEPVFDRSGQVVAWLAGDVIYDLDRHPRAFLTGSAVFTYQRRFIGWCESGFFRDARGLAVAFIRGASGSPATPDPTGVPRAPVPGMAPLPPMPPFPPARPSWAPSWSAISWDAFMMVEAIR